MRTVLIITSSAIVLIGVVTTFGISGVKEYKRTTAIDREIAELRSEVERLERMNADLEDRIAYFSTDAYRERIAKERMGYRRFGERVAVIVSQDEAHTNRYDERDDQEGEDLSPKEASTRSESPGWIKRFFGVAR